MLFNQYTPDNQQSTDFDAVETYFEAVADGPRHQARGVRRRDRLFDDWGATNQATVCTEMFAWLGGQRTESGGKTVPLFLFDAFDRPDYPVGEIGFGVYGENGQSQPTGIKTALTGVIPGWTDQAITKPTNKSEALYGSEDSDTINALSGDDRAAARPRGQRCLARRDRTARRSRREGRNSAAVAATMCLSAGGGTT